MDLLKAPLAGATSKFANIERSSFLPVLAITFLAAVFRLAFILPTDFPLNDGGLFYAMTQDLINAGFTLPAHTTYNLANIPYAYPPLSFYLAAGLNHFLDIPLLEIFRFLPLFFNILTVPVLYLLASELLASQSQAILATLIYAIVLPGFQWQIMGGGMARSPAYLFSLIAIFCSIRLFRSPSPIKIFGTAFFLSLSVLFHLEIAWVSVVSIGVIWLGLDRKKRGLIDLFLVGVITVLLTLPYWISVIRIDGLLPFLYAFRSGSDNWQSLLSFLILGNFLGDIFSPPFSVIAILAFFYFLSLKQYLLPLWLFIVIAVDPRSAGRSMAVPLALLVAAGLYQIVLPGISGKHQFIINDKLVHNSAVTKFRDSYFSLPLQIFLILLISQSILSLYLLHFDEGFGLISLSFEDRQAMSWISANTIPGSKFLILSDHQNWETNMQAEWFPVLAERASVMTVQGTEWLGGDQFDSEKTAYEDLMDCSYRGIACLNAWMDTSGKLPDYIFISKANQRAGSIPAFRWENAEKELRTGEVSDVVFENSKVTVIHLKKDLPSH